MADCYYHGQSFSGPCYPCERNRAAGRKDGDDGDFPASTATSEQPVVLANVGSSRPALWSAAAPLQHSYENIYPWLERSTRSGLPEVEDAARTMMAYYQGAEFPVATVARPATTQAEQIADIILHLISDCVMDWKAGPSGDAEQDAFGSDNEERSTIIGLVSKALADAQVSAVIHDPSMEQIMAREKARRDGLDALFDAFRPGDTGGDHA